MAKTLYDLALEYLNQGMPDITQAPGTTTPTPTPTPTPVTPQNPNAPTLPSGGGGGGGGNNVYNSNSNSNYLTRPYQNAINDSLLGTPDYQGVEQTSGLESLMGKIPGMTMLANAIGSKLPVNQTAILNNELIGAGMQLNDIGQFVSDGGAAYKEDGSNIMAGYNASKVTQETFDKRRAKAKDKMSPKGFAEFNKALTAAEASFFGAKTKADMVFDNKSLSKNPDYISQKIINQKMKEALEGEDDSDEDIDIFNPNNIFKSNNIFTNAPTYNTDPYMSGQDSNDSGGPITGGTNQNDFDGLGPITGGTNQNDFDGLGPITGGTNQNDFVGLGPITGGTNQNDFVGLGPITGGTNQNDYTGNNGPITGGTNQNDFDGFNDFNDFNDFDDGTMTGGIGNSVDDVLGPMPGYQTGTVQRPGSGGGGGDPGCFIKGTLITMLDGTTKPVEQVDLGDEVAVGGSVFAVGRFLNTELYDYKGIKVSGSHMVNEEGTWMRVRDTKHGKSLGDDQNTVYVFGSENRRILINDILFTDYFEIQDQEQLLKEKDKFFDNWKTFANNEDKKNVNTLNAS